MHALVRRLEAGGALAYAGVTTAAQLDECLSAWGTSLSPELLAAIDAVRWELRDPAQ